MSEWLWKDEVDPRTGEHSLKRHEVRPIKYWCKKNEHQYLIANAKKRLASCRKCGHTFTFAPGTHRIDGNKVYLK